MDIGVSYHEGENIVAVRFYTEDGTRMTSWVKREVAERLGLQHGKAYRITVEELVGEYI